MQSIRDIFRLRSTFCIHRCWMTVIPQSESLVSGLDNSFCGGVMNYGCADRISSGMAREISEANHLSIPVKNIGAHEIQKEQLPAEMEQVTASGQGLGMT